MVAAIQFAQESFVRFEIQLVIKRLIVQANLSNKKYLGKLLTEEKVRDKSQEFLANQFKQYIVSYQVISEVTSAEEYKNSKLCKTTSFLTWIRLLSF